MELKIIKRLLLLFSIVISVSCTSEMENVHPEKQCIKAVYESSVSLTKTYLDGFNVLWNKNDTIRVFTGWPDQSKNLGNQYISDESSEGHKEALFTYLGNGEVPLFPKGNICAIYPDSNGKDIYNQNGKVFFDIPSEQTYAEGSFPLKGNYAIAKDELEPGILYFRNLLGILTIRLKGDGAISRIEITSDIEESLWGSAYVNMDYSIELPPTIVFANYQENNNKIVLNCKNTPLSKTEERSFMISIPPGCLSDGFSAKIWNNKGEIMTLHGVCAGEGSIRRSTITRMPVVDFKSDAIEINDDSRQIRITHDNEYISAPILEGDNQGWKVFWDEGIGAVYYPGISYVYDNEGIHIMTLYVDGVTSFTMDNIIGIKCIDLTKY